MKRPKLKLIKGGKPLMVDVAPADPPRNTFDYYIEEFLELKRVKEEWTVEFYRKGLKRYREFPGAKFPPTVENLNGFVRYLQDNPSRRGKPLSPSSIHAYLRAVETWCNWLVRLGVIEENPVKWVEAPSKPKRKVPRAPERSVVKEFIAYLEDQIERLISYGKDTTKDWRLVRDLCFLSLAIDTGMRVGEIENVRLLDIDLARKKIDIPDAKDDEARDVVFGNKARGDLRLWLKTREKLPVPDDVDFLFISNHWGVWQGFTQSGIRQMLERRAEKAGLKYYSAHAFRHFFAGRALQISGNLQYVSDQLGHASLTTTSIYTKMHTDESLETHSKSSPLDNL